ncbi:MAG TPA: cytidylate kinase-like family protein [Verrucomicrobiae bacterium]|nr:cytidylate kinase-like family protein [Verrucomicrobiae bacterium]
MRTQPNLENALAFVNCQLQPVNRLAYRETAACQPRAITISRQAGCGALVVANKLAELLQLRGPKEAPTWTVFDRNLIDKVLEDHNLPRWFAKFLPEDRLSELQDIIDDLFGLHPPSRTVVEHTAETILQLANLGNVILIGRGANIISARLPDVFHVRLVAPLAKRVEHAHTYYDMTEDQARIFCVREDRGRSRYLRKYYRADVNDPLTYHLVINTGLVSYEQAAHLIADTAARKATDVEQNSSREAVAA